MSINFGRFARQIAAPVVCAGAIGAAAIGLAGVANASTGSAAAQVPNPTATVRGPLIVATPQTTVPQWIPPRHRAVLPRSDNGGE